MSRPKSDLDALKEDLRKVYDGDPWHGSSITTVLNGLDADAAMLRSIPRGHNIWELVLHMTGWTREVTSRLRGAAPKSPPEDWPTPPSPGSGTAWRAAQKDLANAQKELESVVDSLSEADLVRWIADQRESSPDAGVTVGTLIRGLLQHHTYHQGQIALLKRAADTFHPSRRRLESTGRENKFVANRASPFAHSTGTTISLTRTMFRRLLAAASMVRGSELSC